MNVFAVYSGINDTLNEKSFNLLSATGSCAVRDERKDRPTPGDKGQMRRNEWKALRQ